MGSISTLTQPAMACLNVPSAYTNGCKTKQNTDRKNSNDEIIIIIESKVNQLQTMMTDRSNICSLVCLLHTHTRTLTCALCFSFLFEQCRMSWVFCSTLFSLICQKIIHLSTFFRRQNELIIQCYGHTWECSFFLPKQMSTLSAIDWLCLVYETTSIHITWSGKQIKTHSTGRYEDTHEKLTHI